MKKMFKSLVIGLALIGLVAGGAFADVSANNNLSGFAYDVDTSNRYRGNEYAVSIATGGGTFDVTASTRGRDFAGVDVNGNAAGFSHAYTDTHDYGTTSTSSAGAQVFGTAYANGSTLAGWTDWCGHGVDSNINGNTGFAATVTQNNFSKESGYSAGNIEAYNYSTGTIDNSESFSDNHDTYGGNYESGFSKGHITTNGSTQVSIDPYGNSRSISGFTTTATDANTNMSGDSRTTQMAGNGYIEGVIAGSTGAWAGGGASFAYSGTTDKASGYANMNAQVNITSHSTTVSANASSYATTNTGH